jgi:hypothetical protein
VSLITFRLAPFLPFFLSSISALMSIVECANDNGVELDTDSDAESDESESPSWGSDFFLWNQPIVLQFYGDTVHQYTIRGGNSNHQRWTRFEREIHVIVFVEWTTSLCPDCCSFLPNISKPPTLSRDLVLSSTITTSIVPITPLPAIYVREEN